MVGGKEHQTVAEVVLDPVTKGQSGSRRKPATLSQQREKSVHRHLAQSQDGSHLCQESPLTTEILATEMELPGSRLIGRRSATGQGCYVAIAQAEPVAPSDGRGLVRKARPVKGGEEKVPRAVPREDPARAVGAVSSRRQADDQQPGLRVAEARHGTPPILLISEALDPDAGHRLAPASKARTSLARDDVASDTRQGISSHPRVTLETVGVRGPVRRPRKPSRPRGRSRLELPWRGWPEPDRRSRRAVRQRLGSERAACAPRPSVC
jgi:hypothetical protein